MYLRAFAVGGGIIKPTLFREGTDLGDSYSPVYMSQRPLDQLFEIVKIHRARSTQHNQVSPSLGSEPAAFVRTLHPQGRLTRQNRAVPQWLGCSIALKKGKNLTNLPPVVPL